VDGGASLADPVPTEVLAYPAAEEEMIDLASGDNTIDLPYSKVTRLFIIPPSDNTETLTLKGAAADTGIALDPAGVTRLPFPTTSPPSSIILNAGGAVTAVRLVWR
jgi:hypothetical protein